MPYKPLLDEAIELAKHKPAACLILQRPQCEAPLDAGPRPRLAHGVGERGQLRQDQSSACRSPPPIRSTSSTRRARPASRKAWCATMAATWSRSNGRCRTLYGVEPGEVCWAASDIGWVVGHSYIVYAPLLHGCTTILYEGKPVGTPDAGAFWRVIAQHGVVSLFTAPTAFRAIKKEDPKGEFIAKYDLSKFRTLFLAGERADPPTIKWAEEMLQRAGARSLVADRDRLVHRRQSGRARRAAGELRLGLRADAGLRHRHRRRGQQGAAGQQDRLDRGQAAAAAGLPPDAVAAGRALQGKLPRGVPRLLQDRRRRLHGRRRLRLRHEPHRRHHQRRRPPALDRRHGGGAGRRTRTSPSAR